MKKIETAFYQIIASIPVYLLLFFAWKFLSLLLRHWFLLLVIAAAVYFAYRYRKPGMEPWWWAKAKDVLLRFKRKGGNKSGI